MPEPSTCQMIAIENGDLSLEWECSECATKFPESKKLSKATVCPECGRTITDWAGLEDE